MNATEIMDAHKKDAWDNLLHAFEVNQATATTARALFMAGWDAAMIRAAEAMREGRNEVQRLQALLACAYATADIHEHVTLAVLQGGGMRSTNIHEIWP